ncbi:MAG: hypothetical protein RLZZ474_1270 [Bacteroidota bacterium]
MLCSPIIYTKMKRVIVSILICFIGLAACQSKNEAAYYFSDSERDTLLTNIISIISEKALYATDSTKYQAQFRAEYVKRLPLFRIVQLTKDTLGVYTYLISRPVAGRKELRRGVVGRFTLKPNTLEIDQFEEVVNTPHFDEKIVEERGGFLFRELVKSGSLNAYLSMKHYVEWPDSTLKYDKQKRAWVSTFGF